MSIIIINGIQYRQQFNELDEIGGCCQLDGKDFQECEDCIHEKGGVCLIEEPEDPEEY
jgi:hypothetical protein